MWDMNEHEEQVDSSIYPFLAHAKPRPGQLEMIQDGIKALEKGRLPSRSGPNWYWKNRSIPGRRS